MAMFSCRQTRGERKRVWSEQVLYAKPMLLEFGETGYLKSSGVGSSACEEKGGAGGAQQRACNRAQHSHYPQERLYSR